MNKKQETQTIHRMIIHILKLPILIILMTIISTNGQSQSKSKFFLNSERIFFDSIFINPKNIDTVIFRNDTVNFKIYDKNWRFKRINEILWDNSLYSNQISKDDFPVFFVNGKLMNKKSDAKIDNTYFTAIRFYRLSKVSGLPGDSRNIVIVNISLFDEDPNEGSSMQPEIHPLLEKILTPKK